MPKYVPMYLKEISTALSGRQEGDDAWEWDFAESPIQSGETDPHHAKTHGGQYLGWWGRGRRGVYYFGEHQRPAYFKDPESYYWDAYDWYKGVAAKINVAFEKEEKVQNALRKNPNLFSEKDLTADTPELDTYYAPVIRKPDHIRNINGIYAWLHDKYAPTERFLNDYNVKASKYNDAIRALKIERYKQDKVEKENIKKAAEDTKYNNITTQLTNLRHEIVKMSKDIKQLNKGKNEEFSLFRSELMSRIPDASLNVSKVEHDEDIAQLNETLNGIKGSMEKKSKKTDDSIAKLQKQVNLSMGENSELNNSIKTVKRSVGVIIGSNARLNSIAKKQKETIQQQAKKSDMLSQEQQAQADKIANLRKDLQALGGETREFIDNTKHLEMASKAKVAKKESVVTRTVKKAAFPDLTKRPWLKESVTGRFFQLVNQW